jgi:hypothetical protein
MKSMCCIKEGVMAKFSLLTIFLILLFCSPVNSDALLLPDTGQTKCYQGVGPYGEIPCGVTGQNGEFNIKPMSYPTRLTYL